MNPQRFDVEAVLHKWGFQQRVCGGWDVLPTVVEWRGELDGTTHRIPEVQAYRFAHLLLMRN